MDGRYDNANLLSMSRLPTNIEMVHHIRDTKQKHPWHSVPLHVASTLVMLWARTDIPTLSVAQVAKQIVRLDKNFASVMLSRTKAQSVPLKMTDLFDIAACKCVDFGKCTCEQLNKVPAGQCQAFLTDQRGDRKLTFEDYKTVDDDADSEAEMEFHDAVENPSSAAAPRPYAETSEDEGDDEIERRYGEKMKSFFDVNRRQGISMRESVGMMTGALKDIGIPLEQLLGLKI